jgi:ketosteroid isomerase-like protein
MSSTIGSDRQALQALAERMVAAELAGDAAFFEHVLAEDVVIMPPGIPAVEGLTPCLAFIRQVLAEIQREFERTITDHPAELTVHGNLALDRGAFEQTLVPKAGGQTIYENWQYLRVFLRDNNGAWKLARVIWNQLESPAWQIEHSVEADVSSALAWGFWTNIANWDDPPAKFILVGPFADGSTGSTLIPGQAPLSWRIRDVNPGRSATIEMPLDAAALTFRWTFEPSGDRRTRITQRIALIGENAAAFVEQAQAGFASNLAAGMTRIAAAMSRADAEPEKS